MFVYAFNVLLFPQSQLGPGQPSGWTSSIPTEGCFLAALAATKPATMQLRRWCGRKQKIAAVTTTYLQLREEKRLEITKLSKAMLSSGLPVLERLQKIKDANP